MLIDGATQTNNNNLELHRRALREQYMNEGLQLWRKQQEIAKYKKMREQQELRDMLEKYWPFGRASDMKPRGLRNLRLEGLFPNRDYLNAKRFVGTLDLGRPGGGAPMVTDTGKKVTRTREDPLLRFQFGSHDLRRCVDNTLRYKADRMVKEEYKRELDKLVEDKKMFEEKKKQQEREAERKQGWSNEATLKKLEENEVHKNEHAKKSENVKIPKPRKIDPVFHPCRNVYVGSKNRKLSPLREGKASGIELVPLMAKQRRFPLKFHLDTTDVTNDRKIRYDTLWNRQGSAYLRELAQQMSSKAQQLKELKNEENERIQRHFSTWDGFWGRPGHGAPRSAIKKQRLDMLLYPQMVPIGVH